MSVFRHENKYFISQAGYQFLKGRLAAAMELDPHSVRTGGQYWIRSLYFDDYNQSGLQDKQNGRDIREKFRIRLYNLDDSFIRLESKQKHNQLTRKEAAPLSRQQTESILQGDLWFLYDSPDPLLRSFYLKGRTRLLRPVVIVDYLREAYLFEDVRITFDMHLRSGGYRTDLFAPDILGVPIFPDDRLILEVKFDERLPGSVRELLRPVPATRSAISKYELCRKIL